MNSLPSVIRCLGAACPVNQPPHIAAWVVPRRRAVAGVFGIERLRPDSSLIVTSNEHFGRGGRQHLPAPEKLRSATWAS